MTDSLEHECGVFGVHGHDEAPNLTYLGLHALQHRGQESCGIATASDGTMRVHRAMGLVADTFTADVLGRLEGDLAIGHVRYSTHGGSIIKNAQPFTVEMRGGGQARGGGTQGGGTKGGGTRGSNLAIAHNGNLVNAERLRRRLEEEGDLFFTSTDTEVIAHLLARRRKGSLAERFAEIMPELEGAYSLLMLSGDTMVAARDPHGFRPLILGRRGSAHIVSSETCALDLIEGQFVRELSPGELVEISPEGVRSLFPLGRTPPAERRACIFELIYFARPDSRLFGRSVYADRKALGRRLAQDRPVEGADCVIPVPDSGVGAALGYAQQAGVPFEMGLIRSHYVGRTFIEPSESIRHFGVRLKLSPVRQLIRGRTLVVVDDSLVRATTSRKIVAMLRGAGAKAVHVRISCPPILWPCYYGIDTPEREQLIAASMSVEEIADHIDADSLGYLGHEGMLEAVGGACGGYCDACFTGDYPAPPGAETSPSKPCLVET